MRKMNRDDYVPEVWDTFNKKSDKEINRIAEENYPDNMELVYNGTNSDGELIFNKKKKTE